MAKRIRLALWYVIPFGLVLVALSTLRHSQPSVVVSSELAPRGDDLLDLVLSEASLVEARLNHETPLAVTVPDTAVVLFLGAISCSGDQVRALQQTAEINNFPGHRLLPIIAIYVDPNTALNQGMREARILRRVSQSEIPIFVSRDSVMMERANRTRMPQLTLAENRVITHVFGPP